MLSAETIGAIVALFTALGAKEWWQGRAAKRSGMAQLEREQVQLIIQNSKEAEQRVDKCEQEFEKYREVTSNKLLELHRQAVKYEEYIAKLRVTLIESKIEVPERDF